MKVELKYALLYENFLVKSLEGIIKLDNIMLTVHYSDYTFSTICWLPEGVLHDMQEILNVSTGRIK